MRSYARTLTRESTSQLDIIGNFFENHLVSDQTSRLFLTSTAVVKSLQKLNAETFGNQNTTPTVLVGGETEGQR
jgi:hypothetical protein